MCTVVDERENCCRINSHQCCLREKDQTEQFIRDLVWDQSFFMMPPMAVKARTSGLFACLVRETISAGVFCKKLEIIG